MSGNSGNLNVMDDFQDQIDDLRLETELIWERISNLEKKISELETAIRELKKRLEGKK